MIGQTVSHYSIIGKLGEGGMGVVYKALDVVLNRPVALKVINPQLAASAEHTERLLREARTASALNHPNVVTIYEVSEHEGMPYIATEFVEGKTLHELMLPGGLEVQFTLHCARQVAEALRSAHTLGIIHRDIKPQNIMVTPERRIKILDFGLAQWTGVHETLTRTGMIAGTMRYMSPEQIQGQPLDRRTDIFSLGVMMYEMLSGKAPFEGEYHVALLYSILNTEPLPLNELVPSVSHGLSAVVAKCLSKAPDQRFQDCAELLEALDAAESTGSVTARERTDVFPLAPLPTPTVEKTLNKPAIGRSPELGALRSFLEPVLGGEGRTLFLGGEAGVGKTLVASTFMEEARSHGCTILWGRCLSQEAGLPYHPFATALGNHFQPDGTAALDRLFVKASRMGVSFAGRSVLLRSFLKLSAEPIAVQNKEQIWDALLMLLRVMATEHPLLITLDDIHWIDKESLGLFCFLARSIRSLPILLLGIFRSEAHTLDLDETFTNIAVPVRQLKIEGAAEEMTLNRLTQEETARLLRQTLDERDIDPAVIRQLFATTAGNPLFVCELANLMKSTRMLELTNGKWRLTSTTGSVEVPGRIRDVITQRLDGLISEQREMLDIASCDGEYFGSDTLSACLQIDRLSLLRQLQRLEKDHSLIHHEKNGYRFDHPLVRQVLYESILPELREEYHRMIAASLIPRFGSESSAAARISHHLLASRQPMAALDYLVPAAAYARSLCANEESYGYYAKASEILADKRSAPSSLLLQVQEGLGDIASDAGRTEEAAAHYEAMLEMARTLSDTHAEIEALRKKASSFRMVGRIPEALALSETALEKARRTERADLIMECLNTLAFIHTVRGAYDHTVEFSQQALGIAREKADLRGTAISLSNLGVAEVHTGDYRSAANHLTEAKSLQEYIGDRKGLAFTLNYLALVDHRLAQFDAALKYARSSLELKQSLADAAAIPGTINIIGDVYRDTGNVDDAVKHHMQALMLAREQNNRGSQCDNLRDLGFDHLLQGKFTEARRYLDEVLVIAQKYGYMWYETRSMITLGELSLLTGSLEEASKFSRRGLKLARQMNASELITEASWKQAMVMSAEGQQEEAASLLQRGMETAEASGHLLFLWQMYRDLGRILMDGGNPNRAAVAREKGRHLVQAIVEQIQDESIRQSFSQMAEQLDTERDE